MLSALPPSCLGKGTCEEVSWGSLSVEERVKGWADLEGVCQSVCWQERVYSQQSRKVKRWPSVHGLRIPY